MVGLFLKSTTLCGKILHFVVKHSVLWYNITFLWYNITFLWYNITFLWYNITFLWYNITFLWYNITFCSTFVVYLWYICDIFVVFFAMGQPGIVCLDIVAYLKINNYIFMAEICVYVCKIPLNDLDKKILNFEQLGCDNIFNLYIIRKTMFV